MKFPRKANDNPSIKIGCVIDTNNAKYCNQEKRLPLINKLCLNQALASVGKAISIFIETFKE